MWQRCPICEGKGVIENSLSTSCFEKCPVCEGKRIISSVTGLPPSTFEITYSTTDSTTDSTKNIREIYDIYDAFKIPYR